MHAFCHCGKSRIACFVDINHDSNIYFHQGLIPHFVYKITNAASMDQWVVIFKMLHLTTVYKSIKIVLQEHMVSYRVYDRSID